ncbi:MAG: hypothetical protein UU16_C0030G0007 [Candidatus Woesebacteria bacterium GW2011_GWA2_40_7]|uniref:Uncharacterized protein n=3 Tax=Candidatus Woeseibacteriota TaxID=1752722 RepID=A0A0G0P1B8_9BACT|nr:MAG: hypothetical protein UT17_C0004G0252 [Candidatus Woesebacteria bacterium GW2011_GWB1_39_10]KKR73119.1 MAG: hypothetical protein UU16_C0030G0007 [Candidatus Woesebacteria bacterium GW2011_GWA2_40_7]KKS90895.1 MAG: hypothetical protein UV66_C0001G0252 [Candidatus Woesebacteria bacterium GW2011_GWA1_43_12]
MTEVLFDSDQIRLSLIKDAYGRGMRYGQITPDMQIAQWLAVGLKRMEEGQDLFPESLEAIDRMGGTDHPDPFIDPRRKLI